MPLPPIRRPRDENSYRLDGDLPGVDKNDVQVEFTDDNTLTVKGHSKREPTSENPEQLWWYSERSVGDFRRSFRFPGPVDREHIDATLKDGVLSISVPKTGDSTVNRRSHCDFLTSHSCNHSLSNIFIEQNVRNG